MKRHIQVATEKSGPRKLKSVGPERRQVDHRRQPGRQLGDELAGDRPADQPLMSMAECVDDVAGALCAVAYLRTKFVTDI